MTNQPSKTVWPIIHYVDAPAAIGFLKSAFGFTESLLIRDEGDPSVVQHAELRWPEGGGVMVSTANRVEYASARRPTGAARAYIVTDHPDRIHDRAIDAGAELFAPLKDEDYGSRGFSVTDPEGNIWDFGTYAGHP
ncbi:MAG: VOC family protein [Actinomycetota bacterium]